MATAQQSSEPSMEEILASIRRIISEDEQPARKPAPEEPPLELTSRVEAAAPDVADDDLMVFDDPPEPPPAPTPPSRPAAAPAPVLRTPEPAPQPKAAAFEPEEEGLLSEAAFAASASAFTRLAGTMRIAGPGQTLEGLVREMLRPMLKEWLDEHLPALVEAKVEAEVQRITKGAR